MKKTLSIIVIRFISLKVSQSVTDNSYLLSTESESPVACTTWHVVSGWSLIGDADRESLT